MSEQHPGYIASYDLLPKDRPLGQFLLQRLDRVLTEIRGAAAERFEGPGTEDLVRLAQVEQVAIDTAKRRRSEPDETTWARSNPDGSGVGMVEGVVYQFFVPCLGQRDLLRYRPDGGVPGVERDIHGSVVDTYLQFEVRGTVGELAGGGVRQELDARLRTLDAYVAAIDAQAESHNETAREEVLDAISRRRGELGSLGGLDSELEDVPIFDPDPRSRQW